MLLVPAAHLQRPRWDVAETDSGLWVMHEPEPHIWFAAVRGCWCCV